MLSIKSGIKNFYIRLPRPYKVKYETTTIIIHHIKVGVPQEIVFWYVLYLLFTSDLPVTSDINMATFVNNMLQFYQNKSKQTQLHIQTITHTNKTEIAWSNNDVDAIYNGISLLFCKVKQVDECYPF